MTCKRFRKIRIKGYNHLTDRNNSIDCFRLICALLVVSIHTHPFEDQNELLGYIFVQVLPRIAVPFFFCVSGFYYIRQLEAGKKCILRTLFKVFKVYLVWSAIYLIVDIIISLLTSSFSFVTYLKNFIIDFIFYGTYYHLWYIIALMVSILIVGVFFRLRIQRCLVWISIVLYFVGLLGESYYLIGNQIPSISSFVNMPFFTEIRRVFLMGLPFFISGYFVNRFLKKMNKKCIYIFSFVSLILFVVEIIFLHFTGLSKSIVITLFLYPMTVCTMLCMAKHPFKSGAVLAANCKSLADYMFFIHPFFILIAEMVFEYSNIKVINVLLYVIVVILCIISWWVLKKIDLPFIKKYII